MRQLILDTETTGLDPNYGHRIIELAILEMVDRQLTGDKLHLYFNPQREISVEASAIHGITAQDLVDAPVFEDKIDVIVDFIRDADLIIHNAKFDVKFLNHHFLAANYQVVEDYSSNIIDTLTMARRKFIGAKNNLNALCDRFKVNRSNRNYHGALIDCELLAQVYLQLTKEQINLIDTKESDSNEQFANFKSSQNRLAVATEQDINNHNQYLQQHQLINSDTN